jgi:adenylyltransferase/sulfurtransferase
MSESTLRYSRHLNLPAFADDGQQRLAAARVLIIGMGGLGNPAALYLASSGLGHIRINDFDNIDITNLPRQILFRESDIHQPKASSAAARLKELNPNVQTEAHDERLDSAALGKYINQADVVLDCTDNFASRWMINEACAHQRTALVTGAAIRLEGQLTVFRHDLGTGPCFRCLYDEADENLNDCAGQGILAPVAGSIGCMMATEAIKLLLGIESELYGKLWVYDANSGQTRLVGIPQRDDCPVCTARPS